jgi:hypothetical protein
MKQHPSTPVATRPICEEDTRRWARITSILLVSVSWAGGAQFFIFPEANQLPFILGVFLIFAAFIRLYRALRQDAVIDAVANDRFLQHSWWFGPVVAFEVLLYLHSGSSTSSR